VQEAGYNGETIRWLTTKEYDFMYKNTIVAAEQLKERLGMNFDLQVVDYATIVTQRNDPNAYEIFIGATTFTPDPGIWPVFDSNWGGWWVDPVKDELLKKVNTEMDPIKRKQNWDELQAHFWEEVPLIKFGDFFVLSAARNNVHGVQSTPFPFYWNVWKD